MCNADSDCCVSYRSISIPVEDKDDSINKAFEDLGLDNFNLDTLFDSQNNTDNGLEQLLKGFIGDFEESDEIRPEIWYVSSTVY